jgi:hypothetical protein
MKQEQFMIDYFKESDMVTVSARELQQILRDKAKLQRQLKKSEDLRLYLDSRVQTLKSQLLNIAFEQPIKVKLDVEV